MGWVEAAVWGALGGFALASSDYIKAVRRHKRMPWAITESAGRGQDTAARNTLTTRPDEGQQEPAVPAGRWAYGISILLQLGLGAVLAAAAARTISDLSAWIALTLGAAGPTVLDKLSALVPLVLRQLANVPDGLPGATGPPAQQTGQAPEQQGSDTPPATSNGHPTASPDGPANGIALPRTPSQLGIFDVPATSEEGGH